jgi:hypothetical protein
MPCKEGGKINISKRDFINWIFSNQPFDEIVYGSDIRNNIEWINLIDRARKAALDARPLRHKLLNFTG